MSSPSASTRQTPSATRHLPWALESAAQVPDTFLPQALLGGAFYRAVGSQEVPGFTFGSLQARRADGITATVPYFVTRFQFNTMLDEGWPKRLVGNLGIRIACVGHPCAPLGHIDPPEAVDPALLEAVYQHLQHQAPVVAFKGFGPDLPAPGFVRVAGLPVAQLRLRPDFWNTMPHHRRNFKRKRRAAQDIQFQLHDGLPPELLDPVYALYLNTHAAATVRFEQLSRDYFAHTAHLSRYLLAYWEGRLVAFAQLIQRGDRIAAFYMGMDYSVDRQIGLYFALVMQIVDVASAAGCTEVEYGETSYGLKRNLGCELVDTWIYYRHRNPIGNRIMARLAFLLEPSENELR